MRDIVDQEVPSNVVQRGQPTLVVAKRTSVDEAERQEKPIAKKSKVTDAGLNQAARRIWSKDASCPLEWGKEVDKVLGEGAKADKKYISTHQRLVQEHWNNLDPEVQAPFIVAAKQESTEKSPESVIATLPPLIALNISL